MTVDRNGSVDRAVAANSDNALQADRQVRASRRDPASYLQAGPSPRSASEILFVEPRSAGEARKRIADLDYDIAHIDQQFAARDARGVRDPDWRHRANRARMAKDLERSRLRIWLEELRSGESWDFLKAIVETVKPDYDPDEWREVLDEAQRRLRGGAGR